MKNVIKIAMCFLTLTLFCQCSKEYNEIDVSRLRATIFRGQRWDVFRVNDSIIVYIPCGDTDKTLKPITINLNKQ